ncbi:TULIP family P47-like protein [Isoptericola sp. NEAU-Y5]|uniref:TULIP family P47-like protein n=1 Tax=Isoptericola luteus TaxID=2879484 RepID=A0ABS7ZLL6_9MICO|nr:TULIP family P47-like protein [Isoptericola sp. NEAU-Y5]MCA5894860.1 TULIP family P47-like protein [Isoptericola sp. NEAU-Y5]MCA5895236.1 TULIP family P47-like protein [Isoptericola sp. NEAU-Y5]
MVDTYGFDAAYASTVDTANRALDTWFGKQPPLRLHYDGSDTADQAKIALSSACRPWQIVRGGSNKLLRFAVPLASGTLEVEAPSQGIDHASFDLGGVSVVVEVQLGWFPHGPEQTAAGSGGGTARALALNLSTRGAGVGDSTPGAVTTVSVSDPGNKLSELGSAVLAEVFPDVLIAHRADVGHVFATLVPVPDGADAWMNPTAWDYFYQESSQGPAVLCVLTVVTGRTLPATSAFDASVLVAGADRFAVVSGLQLLTHGLLPALPKAFGGGTFAVTPTSDTTATIVNVGPVRTRTTSWGADTYYPHIDSYALSIDGSDVVTAVQGRCDITGLADAYITFSGTKTAAMSYSPDTGALSTGSPSGRIDSSKHIPWYDWVFGALSGGIGIAIIDGVISAVTDTVTASVADAVSTSLDASIASTALAVCDWAGPRTDPTAGGLSGALWLAGTVSTNSR